MDAESLGVEESPGVIGGSWDARVETSASHADISSNSAADIVAAEENMEADETKETRATPSSPERGNHRCGMESSHDERSHRFGEEPSSLHHYVTPGGLVNDSSSDPSHFILPASTGPNEATEQGPVHVLPPAWMQSPFYGGHSQALSSATHGALGQHGGGGHSTRHNSMGHGLPAMTVSGGLLTNMAPQLSNGSIPASGVSCRYLCVTEVAKTSSACAACTRR